MQPISTNKTIPMRYFRIILILLVIAVFVACAKDDSQKPIDTSDEIIVDSLVASQYSVKAWDTTTISCYAQGVELVYAWEVDHGSINGSGAQIQYAAGECCVGTNTVTCTVSNESGQIVRQIQIEVTSYFGGSK